MDETPNELEKQLFSIMSLSLLKNRNIKNFLEKMHKEKRLDTLLKENAVIISLQEIIEHVVNYADGIDEIHNQTPDKPEINALTDLIFKGLTEDLSVKVFIHNVDKKFLDELIERNVHVSIILEDFINKVIYPVPRLNLHITRYPTKNALQEQRVPRQSIDGKVLTPNEVAFEEWCAERFDEKDWLEKHKIMLDPLEQEEKHDKRKKKIKPLLYSI